MTENMKQYRIMYENAEIGAEFDKPTRKMACEWIDTQIEYYNKLGELENEYIFPLVYGELLGEIGEFKNEIINTFGNKPLGICGINPRLTIYKGIEKLAEIMGEELYVGYHDEEYPYCYWFRYDKYIIDLIEKDELLGVKCEKRDYR